MPVRPPGSSLPLPVVAFLVLASSVPGEGAGQEPTDERRWIAGDHHTHSRYSVGWDDATDPPTAIVGGDAIYPIPMNALMARHFGLRWMVSTDHGGPNHAKVNLEMAYPELLMSREVVPEVIQFYGMEFDTPGADHSSIIVPHSHDEGERLYELERGWSKREVWPRDRARDTLRKMIEALEFMRKLEAPPVVIAHHPSRSASQVGGYGLDEPAELRAWNDAAPEVAVGMEGAPGHQAAALASDGTLDPGGARGGYGRNPTMGGFDPMTARLGGFWDSMLGEGRRWWITANSDSHVHWREGGSDFWPGEYSKTWVLARPEYDDILDGIRQGRVFVSTGDLVTELWVTASVDGGQAEIGGELEVGSGDEVQVTLRIRDPQGPNANGDRPQVARVDLIVGEVHGPLSDPTIDTNATTQVVRRFREADWTREGEWLTMSLALEASAFDRYVRVRGTSTTEAEPTLDPRGEDPWADLWFYSNPIFLTVR